MGDEFDNPAQLSPLFTAQFTTCAYPVSDLYASSPRILFYVLLASVFIFQWHPWLANVFLGAAATYAGTAAIQSFILIASRHKFPPHDTITIPYINGTEAAHNATLSGLQNLVVNTTTLDVRPAALELDIDAILAITVSAYLLMLPIHCFSSTVKEHRAYHLLMTIWNILMLAGSICAIILWPTLFEAPLQQRFCYPQYPDDAQVSSNGDSLPNGAWQGDWNSTIWHVFFDLDLALQLDFSCMYPCFNTTQIMRRQSSLVSSLTASDKSPRTQFSDILGGGYKIERFIGLMYFAIFFVASVGIVLLLINVTGMHRFTRVPIHKPRLLLKDPGKDVARALVADLRNFARLTARIVAHPRLASRRLRAIDQRAFVKASSKFLRFWLDILAILILFVALVLTPGTMVVFIAFIEWFIRHDLVSQEAPSQVGQWTSSVSIALVLISALILRTKNWMATPEEITLDIRKKQEQLQRLEELLQKKRGLLGHVDVELDSLSRASYVTASGTDTDTNTMQQSRRVSKAYP